MVVIFTKRVRCWSSGAEIELIHTRCVFRMWKLTPTLPLNSHMVLQVRPACEGLSWDSGQGAEWDLAGWCVVRISPRSDEADRDPRNPGRRKRCNRHC